MKDVCARDPAMALLQYPNTKLPMPATKIVCNAGQSRTSSGSTYAYHDIGSGHLYRYMGLHPPGGSKCYSVVQECHFWLYDAGGSANFKAKTWGRSGYQLFAGASPSFCVEHGQG
jgi:hypothetical protein